MKHHQTATRRSQAAAQNPPPPVTDDGQAQAAGSREEAIRCRAYALYEARGCAEGHALDDWLQAEAASAPAASDGGSRISH